MGKIINVKPLKEKLIKELKERVNDLKERGINPEIYFLVSKSSKDALIFHRILVNLAEEIGIFTKNWISQILPLTE